MRRAHNRHMMAATTAAALAVLTLTALPASADGGGGGGGRSIVRSELVGSMPAPSSPQIAGVNPGAAPWVNGPSRVRVSVDGRIKVTIRGLVIPPPAGTGVNPITSVVATLVCGDAVRTSTAPFALSNAGDGSTTQVVDVAGECADPVALIQPAANRAVYIASTTAGRH